MYVMGSKRRSERYKIALLKRVYKSEHLAWVQMRQRCTPAWPRRDCYYDRGITVCEAWQASFLPFFEHIGPKPTWCPHSLDRINNDGNYEPGNVRWATTSQQMANRRSWKLTEEALGKLRTRAKGRVKCDWEAAREDWETSELTQREMAARYGVSQARICQVARKQGWLNNRSTGSTGP